MNRKEIRKILDTKVWPAVKALLENIEVPRPRINVASLRLLLDIPDYYVESESLWNKQCLLLLADGSLVDVPHRTYTNRQETGQAIWQAINGQRESVEGVIVINFIIGTDGSTGGIIDFSCYLPPRGDWQALIRECIQVDALIRKVEEGIREGNLSAVRQGNRGIRLLLSS